MIGPRFSTSPQAQDSKTMKNPVLILAILAATAAPALAANPPPPQMQPRILLVGRQAVLRGSKVGQGMARQGEAYADEAKADSAGQQKGLEAEAQVLR